MEMKLKKGKACKGSQVAAAFHLPPFCYMAEMLIRLKNHVNQSINHLFEMLVNVLIVLLIYMNHVFEFLLYVFMGTYLDFNI